MRDVNLDSDETPYECFDCGQILVVEEPRSRCPDCSGELRNRQMPIE